MVLIVFLKSSKEILKYFESKNGVIYLINTINILRIILRGICVVGVEL